jgi:LAO/AO transport system kinase
MLSIGPKTEWRPPIVKTSTATGEGIADLWQAIEKHRKHQESSGALERKRTKRILDEVKDMAAFRLRDRVAGELGEDSGAFLVEDLAARRVDPYRAAEILLERVTGQEARVMTGAHGRAGTTP